jgi:DNA-binding HxlR family transcriptional regulator
MEAHTKPFCSFQPLIELLSRKHALSILYAIFTENPSRFSELRRRTGVNPRTLTDRLRELEEAGIIRRQAYSEIPPRVEYSLTEKGRALARMFESLESWQVQYGG